MFDLGRELKRLFRPQAAFSPPKDGLTGGDPALLELLDLNLLRSEAKACDVAAGRISAKDRPMRQLEQAQAWRELARRTGDAVALRKAASAAETAATGFRRAHRLKAWALARAEQGRCAALGAELFAQEGLIAAAAAAFSEAALEADKISSVVVAKARLDCLAAIDSGDADLSLATVTQFEALLPPGAKVGKGARLAGVQARADLCEVLVLFAERFCDERLAERAIGRLRVLASAIDPDYEPLTWLRVEALRARAQILLGELTGEAAHIAEGVRLLNQALDEINRDHSPLDWAGAQLVLAGGLQSLGEATEAADALDRAVSVYDRALAVLRRQPALGLRAVAAVNRALCIARRAELSPDLHRIDEAEANFRCELASADTKLDPVGWAICQLALARIYEVRMARLGQDRGERKRALMALNEALEVFSEAGLRTLSDLAVTAMDRLQARRTVR